MLPPTQITKATRQEAADHFDDAMNYVSQLEQFEMTQAHEKTLLHLNQWLEHQSKDEDWIADPFFSRLPSRYPEARQADLLSKMQFSADDAFYLQQAVWIRDVARHVAARASVDEPANQLLPDAAWLESLAGMEREEIADIRTVWHLFDWTVRNVQTDPPRTVSGAPQPPPPQADPTAGPAPAPTGARLVPWQAMLLGRGDWLEKSRVFIQLARQHGVAVVVLGTEAEENEEPRPWCTAALIHGELYLFDMQMGIPVPGTGGRGIATLKQVLADPTILRQLDVPDRPYPLSPAGLGTLVALIDAPPEALSQRMRLVERRLAGDERMALTVSPTTLRDMLPTQGITRVALWEVPYQQLEFRRGLMGQPAALQEFYEPFRMFEGVTALMQARLLQFRGHYEDEVDVQGAKYYLMESRPENRAIAELRSSTDPAQAPIELPADPQARQRALENISRVLTQMKQVATYWLGLTEFEMGNYESAVQWLEKRTLQSDQETPWKRGATYNLARTYERWGITANDRSHIERAIGLYESTLVEDPCYAGNRWRAATLKGIASAIK